MQSKTYLIFVARTRLVESIQKTRVCRVVRFLKLFAGVDGKIERTKLQERTIKSGIILQIARSIFGWRSVRMSRSDSSVLTVAL